MGVHVPVSPAGHSDGHVSVPSLYTSLPYSVAVLPSKTVPEMVAVPELETAPPYCARQSVLRLGIVAREGEVGAL